MKIKVGGATLNQIPIDWSNNIQNIVKAIQLAKKENIQILCLPELCLTGYGCEDLFLSDWLPAKAVDKLNLIIPETKDITVTVGLPVRWKGQTFNCSCVIQDSRILGFTAKQFLARDGVHYEPRWFTPWPKEKVDKIKIGEESFPIGDLPYDLYGVMTGFEICEDAWRGDDRPACRLYERGVQMILNPSASHFALCKTKVREELVISSSKRFECVYVYANLLGNEAGRMIYEGEIMIAQKGKLLAKNELLSFQKINLQTAEINIEDPEPKEINFQSCSKEEEFVRAEALALFDYLRKSRSRGYVLSLSGGADSSVCAVLVSEMVRRGVRTLGTNIFLERIGYSEFTDKIDPKSSIEQIAKQIVGHIFTCVYQGTRNSSEDTLESASKLAQSIGANFHHWTIDDEVESYTAKVEKALEQELAWETDDITLQNIQARARSPIVWMIANKKNSILLTTSNRSEGNVGYATMDGDTSGSLAPIAAIDKDFIIHWLKWAEKELGYIALRYVNNLTPTAELRPQDRNQTDEQDLMPYHILVEIERLAIGEYNSPIEVFRRLSDKNLEDPSQLKAHIIRFYQLWSRNQWKRERLAPSFHLDDFNVDPRTWYRFPILSGSFHEELEQLRNLNGVPKAIF